MVGSHLLRTLRRYGLAVSAVASALLLHAFLAPANGAANHSAVHGCVIISCLVWGV